MLEKNKTLGWGKVSHDGSEIWDAEPIFKNDKVEFKDWLRLLFYPKKWFLYRYLKKNVDKFLLEQPTAHVVGFNVEPIRILDVGCGTGSDVIDFKKMFGRKVEVFGVDVVAMQVDLANEKIKKNGIWAKVLWFDGNKLPFEDNSISAIYTSDVLGHVKDVPAWLDELNRVLKPGGVLAMFSESKLGRQAYIRNYLMKRGLNIDPHAEFHISLYSKQELKEKIIEAGFEIEKMYSVFWNSFFVHPDEFFGKLQNQPRFPILRFINKILFRLKAKFRPYSLALSEFYGLIEIYLVGKWVEAQGYIILMRKIK